MKNEWMLFFQITVYQELAFLFDLTNKQLLKWLIWYCTTSYSSILLTEASVPNSLLGPLCNGWTFCLLCRLWQSLSNGNLWDANQIKGKIINGAPIVLSEVYQTKHNEIERNYIFCTVCLVRHVSPWAGPAAETEWVEAAFYCKGYFSLTWRCNPSVVSFAEWLPTIFCFSLHTLVHLNSV